MFDESESWRQSGQGCIIPKDPQLLQHGIEMCEKYSSSRLSYCRIRLTTGSGDRERVPHASGLNWGQRPGREPNQAYLPVSVDIQREQFFPDVGITFVLKTDDGHEFICKRAQQNGKAIHSENNSDLGRYFRQRLGVTPGGLVSMGHLLKFGRTSVDIYKICEREFLMDFSLN